MSNSPLEHGRICTAIEAEHSLVQKLTSQICALHIDIERLAAAFAQRHSLRLNRCETTIADRKRRKTRKRTDANAAVRRKDCRYKIVHDRTKSNARAGSHYLRQTHSCATIVQSGAEAKRRAGRSIERTLIQAFAEDAPAHTTLQAAWAAPML